ncbi:XkdQ/YqbQ family protein [Acetanaerobacterium elongatum]|uniref:YqbQ/XkdQ domain-containing protein n=1 Tax=Acetanaerobacterium elongatum TaxID=258515 RepID=A0A1G9Z3P7_9FIRM|nr:hypothetical protein [Acetanaerobacterium elongatum]SDN15421.1 hypothetical protein SAMN05192585_11266 [Acetanaerobacterium elongatum]
MELLLENAEVGKVLDLTDIAEKIKFQDQWNNGTAKFCFEYPAQVGDMYPNGSVVRFKYANAGIFFGYLFTTSQDKSTYKCTCYDQLRYMKASDTVMRKKMTLTQFVNLCAANLQLRVGKFDNTELVLDDYLFDGKTYLDMVYDSIKENLLGNGYYYTLYDNFGALDLRDTLDLRLPLVLGDYSLATDFEYSKSIDEDTYNYVKVAQDNKDAGVRNSYCAEDVGNMKRWGKLMFYHKSSGNKNEAQLAELANNILAAKNRETQTLSIEAIGDVRVRGGSGIKVEIAEAGLDLWAVVDNVTHEFTRSIHTMKLNLIIGGPLSVKST